VASRKTAIALHEGGPRKVSPFYVPSTIINMVPGHLCIMQGLQGPELLRRFGLRHVEPFDRHGHAHDPVRRRRHHGRGGAEHGCTPTSVAGFCSHEGLSTRNDEPTARQPPVGPRPRRLRARRRRRHPVLEEYESAKARGARIYCELVGFGASPTRTT
jgi:3-oxoacyl-[acyl-carrier-protein] synthase II